VVTAQKREQLAQDIPISMSVIRGEDIDRLANRDFHGPLLSIPGVSYSGEESSLGRYSIRGISTTASNPTVGIYLNDVSLVTLSTNWTGAVEPMLVDLERVEVRRVSLLFLRGATVAEGIAALVLGPALLILVRPDGLFRCALTPSGPPFGSSAPLRAARGRWRYRSPLLSKRGLR